MPREVLNPFWNDPPEPARRPFVDDLNDDPEVDSDAKVRRRPRKSAGHRAVRDAIGVFDERLDVPGLGRLTVRLRAGNGHVDKTAKVWWAPGKRVVVTRAGSLVPPEYAARAEALGVTLVIAEPGQDAAAAVRARFGTGPGTSEVPHPPADPGD